MYSAKDEIKFKLNKLMSNPDKPVEIPQKKDKKISEGPDFVRNIMGSSAGANSGDFFVFNNLRRKEYARQKIIEIEAKNESLNDEYHKKLEENKRSAEERTAKKRNKRLKKKQKSKKQKNNKEIENDSENSNLEKNEDDNEEDDNEETNNEKANNKKANNQEANNE